MTDTDGGLITSGERPVEEPFWTVMESNGKELLRLTPEMVTLLAAAFAASAEWVRYDKPWTREDEEMCRGSEGWVMAVKAEAWAYDAVRDAARERARKGER